MTHRVESAESLEQLTVGWNAMVPDRNPAADVRDLPGIAVRWPDCQFAFWNALALTEAGARAELLEQRLGQAADIMRAKTHPGFLWIFDDLLDEDAREGLTAKGRLFVVLVATDPAWQRRGYGEAVTRKALYEGGRATGLTRATLHATVAGEPVYRRIGFKPNSPMSCYTLNG